MNNILCPTDLSATSGKAVTYAQLMARQLQSSVCLLHLSDKQEARGGGREAARAAMDAQRAQVTGVPVDVQFREGEFMQGIAEESSNGHALMVCATHGPRGLKQSLFGADILKLVRKVKVPSLVVQAQSPDRNHFGTIVMPVAGHPEIANLLDAVCLVAKQFGSTVHIYRLVRPGEEPSEQLMDNRVRMETRLRKEGIDYRNVEEPSHAFSVGFSAATIQYAQREQAGCIAIMAVASDEFRYIADAEKERLLTNEAGIPVLCAACAK